MVVLDKTGSDPNLLKVLLVIGLQEKTPVVAEHPRFDQRHSGQPRFRSV
jgi:hypothetical protein